MTFYESQNYDNGFLLRIAYYHYSEIAIVTFLILQLNVFLQSFIWCSQFFYWRQNHVAQKVNINTNITEHPITMGTSSMPSFSPNHVIDQDIDTMEIMKNI